MKTPITKKRLQDHFAYSWWKYGLLCVIAFMAWSIVYATTEYRPPEEKKVVMGVYSASSDVNANIYMQEVQRLYMPDMELLEAQYILPDQQYGSMILLTRVAGQECDIYVLPTQQFQSWAGQGACQPLELLLPELIQDLTDAGVSLSRGFRQADNTGEKHQFGIPCRDLPGAPLLLGMTEAEAADMYICVFHNTGNDENVLKFTDILVRDMMNEEIIFEPGVAQ